MKTKRRKDIINVKSNQIDEKKRRFSQPVANYENKTRKYYDKDLSQVVHNAQKKKSNLLK